jgi:hypothetical protein
MARLSIFMVMTIVKAFYIVSSFMHLGDEVKKLAMAILLPFLFIVWLLIALGKDGDSYGSSANRAGNYTYKKIESTHGHGGGHDAPAHTPAKAGESHGH